jgi:hypothetical protein
VDEMPEPPLHHNCRCTRLVIYDWSKVLPENGNASVFGVNEVKVDGNIPMKGEEVLGIQWTFLTPLYGSCGGANYPKNSLTAKPVDDMDAVFCNHDNCYRFGCPDESFFSECKIQCDRALLDGVRAMPDDPSQLANRTWPLSEKYMNYFAKYKQWADIFFEWKTRRHDANVALSNYTTDFD